MRVSLGALAALVLILAGPARADRILDGYWWSTQTDEGKQVYVLGLSDGLPLGARFAAGPDATTTPAFTGAYNRYLAGVPNRVLLAHLETFYRDPQNLGIPLPDAVTIVLKQMAGDADTDAALARLRAPPSAP